MPLPSEEHLHLARFHPEAHLTASTELVFYPYSRKGVARSVFQH
jgi:hypothetical protein